MDTFTTRELRECTGELIRDAEVGKLSIVTKHGQPIMYVENQRRNHMGNTDIIAREVDSPPVEEQAEVNDFIEFIKNNQAHKNSTSLPMPPEEIEALFRSFNVDTSDYKFDREDANTR